jgi:enoyl-[acyl-carrier protein] reductase II
VRNDYTQFFENHPDELARFPDQIGRSISDGAMHLGAPPETDGIDPAKECYAAGQGLGGIHQIVPAGQIVHQIVQEAELELDRLGSLRTPAQA